MKRKKYDKYTQVMMTFLIDDVNNLILTDKEKEELKRLTRTISDDKVLHASDKRAFSYASEFAHTKVKEYRESRVTKNKDRLIYLISKPKNIIDALKILVENKVNKLGVQAAKYFTHTKKSKYYIVSVDILYRYTGYLDFLNYCNITGRRKFFTKENTEEKQAYLRWLKIKDRNRTAICYT